jgi:Aldo/keto reductase family
LLRKNTQRVAVRAFSVGTTSASDSEIEAQIRPKLDPLRKQVTDFLKNTSQYED